ncbi:hypothetical protein CLV88_1231 [Shimia abyssi]|uniref:Uncharacterized protein n=1 Tax=Shimia abyssi TaxID=1662395 RepID=A0A2P8F2T2_9RHOB|nr:hypothetical protein CLV88_1231 [Shimia abyssi]
MLTLENDDMIFRFPDLGDDAKFSINFRRTLRIPDTEENYGLPPGLGRFPRAPRRGLQGWASLHTRLNGVSFGNLSPCR